METLVLVVHIAIAIGMIFLILIQQGKGAEAGASFGGGASGTVFGAAGSANFLTRTTAILTAIFFITSLALAVIAKKNATELLRLPSAPVAAQGAKPAPAAKNAPTVSVGANSASNTPTTPVN